MVHSFADIGLVVGFAELLDEKFSLTPVPVEGFGAVGCPGKMLDHARLTINTSLNARHLDPTLREVYAIAFKRLLEFSNLF
jgi:hypothetical protein